MLHYLSISALENRFIVATSRARIGFYIVGALDAVKQADNNSNKKQHCWQRFVASLRDDTTLAIGDATCQNDSANSPQQQQSAASFSLPVEGSSGDGDGDEDGTSMLAESSSNSGGFLQNIARLFGNTDAPVSGSASAVSISADVATTDVTITAVADAAPPTVSTASVTGSYEGRRIGASLPISCPRHRGVGCKNVTNVKDFPDHANWSAFCHEACTFTIPQCGHRCAKLCHSPVLDPHTKQDHCKVVLPRPCELHADVPLYCGKLTILANQSLQTALSAYKCQVRTQLHCIEYY